jgi:hypothetical protein
MPTEFPKDLSSEDISEYVTIAKTRATEFREILSESGKTQGENVIAFFLPYILALAFALRFAKVSGELRL